LQRSWLFDQVVTLVACAAVEFKRISECAEQIRVEFGDFLTQKIVVGVGVGWVKIFDMEKSYTSATAIVILQSKLNCS
jgi:hypothetical protein